MNQPPVKATMLAKLLLDGPKTRKEMVIALLTANGRTYNPKLSGYGSVAFFTPNGGGVGGVYWEPRKDGKYHITALGRALATTGAVATKEQREAAVKKWIEKMNAKYRETRPTPAYIPPVIQKREIFVIIRGNSYPLAEVEAAVKLALA